MASATASSSSSVISPWKKYDVFLSFRGVDTRNNFVSHLHKALCQEKIETYIDDKLERGDEISTSLRKAIEDSKLSIIILSENYVSSSWCLDELVQILDCRKRNGQYVIPVFYRTDPSHVRKQDGSYAAAFGDLEKRFKDNVIKEWRAALTEVANICGKHSLADRAESELVDTIIMDVVKKLNLTSFNDDDLKGFVGIHEHIEALESLSSINSSSNVYIIGIWGMGGIGKTTLVNVVYKKFSSQFEGHCFLNAREELERGGKLIYLQNKLLGGLLGEENLNLRSTPFVKERLRRKKVLVVLDDVNNSCQLECLARKNDWFGSGSRIIITTRDAQVLTNIEVDEKYEVKELHYGDAFELFQANAFKRSKFVMTKFIKLSEQVVNYCKGIPLALVVLGSHLHDRTEEAWESALTKLAKMPHNRVHNVLRISYDELDSCEKDIFLDLACFFKGEERKFIELILDSCGFHPKIGLEVLIDKCLIAMRGNIIWMHDLIQQMGQEIVRRDSMKEPGRRSRLWIAEDVQHVFETNTGTASIEGIFLNMSKIRDLHLHPKIFSKMHNLRLVKFYDSDFVVQSEVQLQEDLSSLPNSLRYFHWHGYPCKSLPRSFTPRHLIELSMPYSKLETLWDGPLELRNLRKIDLRWSKLTQIPDLSRALKLETVWLDHCVKLLQLPPYFKNLEELKVVQLGGCKSFKKFPELSTNIRTLVLRNTSIKEVPSTIEHLSCLEYLDLSFCRGIKSLPTSICKLKSLRSLYLTFLTRLQNFPDILEPMDSLMLLCLNGTQIRELPLSIDNLVGLAFLTLEWCKNLEYLPDSISNLEYLQIVDLFKCWELKSLPKFQRSSPFIDARGCMSLRTLSRDDHNSQVDDRSFIFTDDLNNKKTIIFDPKLGIKQRSRFADETVFGSSIMTFDQGNEIPRLFDNQATGSLITIKLSKNWLPYVPDKSVFSLRLALCVVVEVENYNPCLRFTLNFRCLSQVKFKDGKSHNFECILRGLGEEEDDQTQNLNSSHVLFSWYDYFLYVDGTSDRLIEASFNFYPVDGSKNSVDFCKILSCGVHCVGFE